VSLADGSNDSGILSNLCGCNCMVEIPAGTVAVEKGEEVMVVLI
jgi:molybdopterin molybdotransferase